MVDIQQAMPVTETKQENKKNTSADNLCLGGVCMEMTTERTDHFKPAMKKCVRQSKQKQLSPLVFVVNVEQ